MVNRTLSASQKMFLQAIMHTGFMETKTVKETFIMCRRRFEEDESVEGMQEFLKDINQATRPLNIELRKGFDEDTGVACYVCINGVDDDFMMGSGKYTLKQMEYFKTLLRLIVMSEDGSVSSLDALNAVNTAETKLQKSDAVELIKSEWVNGQHWLKGVRPVDQIHNPDLQPSQDDGEQEEAAATGMLTLGSRAIIELEHYMREVYPEYIKDCDVCHRICIRGLLCVKCHCKIHPGCVKSYLARQKTSVPQCPNANCKTNRPELLQYRKASTRMSQSQK